MIKLLSRFVMSIFREDESLLNIKFINTKERIKGERKSKLLSPKCSLYKYIEKCRFILTSNYPPEGSRPEGYPPKGSRPEGYPLDKIDFRPPHIELLKDFEKNDVNSLVKRTLELENKDVPIKLLKMGRALVIPTGNVEGYGSTHATIAFFPNGFDLEQILSSLRELD